jgi:hypothetical protein
MSKPSIHTIYPDDPNLKRLMVEVEEYGYEYKPVYNNGKLNHYQLMKKPTERKPCNCRGR